MTRLIACDLDGTLLPEGTRSIDTDIYDEILRLRDKGIVFCPASGRQYSSMRRLFDKVKDGMCFICENGALIYGPDGIMDSQSMDRQLSLALCRDILCVPGAELLCSGADTSYLVRCSDAFAWHMEHNVGNNVSVLGDISEMPEDFHKISIFLPNEVERAKDALLPKWEGVFCCAVAGRDWLDFMPTDKGRGLRRLCDILGVSLAEVMAFGDNENDVSMLSLAGAPYIMESASHSLRSRFPRHCRRVVEVLRTL